MTDSSTREVLLNGAERLFAEKGFAATSIKDIGREAGINTALLYYYFRDKDELYREVLSRAAAALGSQVGHQLDAATSPAEGVRLLVQAQARFITTHPHVPKLFLRELIDHDARRGATLITQHMGKLFGRVCALIEEGQRRGEFAPSLTPRLAAISILAQIVYFAVARPALNQLSAAGETGPLPDLTDFGLHAADFAVSALSSLLPHPRS